MLGSLGSWVFFLSKLVLSAGRQCLRAAQILQLKTLITVSTWKAGKQGGPCIFLQRNVLFLICLEITKAIMFSGETYTLSLCAVCICVYTINLNVHRSHGRSKRPVKKRKTSQQQHLKMKG